MSSARLCLAGLLVAGGLILGAFTLHGYFDPQWAERQGRTAGPRPAATQAVPAFQGRNRFVAREEKAPASAARMTAAAAPAAHTPATKVAGTPAKAVAPRKKVVDKTKPAPSQQQASFGWPWNLFNN